MIWEIIGTLYLWAAVTVWLLFRRLTPYRVAGLEEGAVWISLLWPVLVPWVLYDIVFGEG